MKKKSLTMLLTSLLAMSLTGVGFASWIIVQGDTQEPTGTVSVEKIEKHIVKINFAWLDNDGDKKTGNEDTDGGDNILNFGYKGATNTGWLRNTDDDDIGGTELKCTITTTHDTNVDNPAGEVVLTTEFAVVDNGSAGFAAAKTKGYIKNVTFAAVTGEENTYKISISWGETFGNKNPYEYYNALEATESNFNAAVSAIGELKSLLEGVTFKLTLNANYVETPISE